MYIGVEVSTRCNARCPWCFALRPGDSADSGQTGIMSIDFFTAVIERLQTLGFLHKDVIINLYEIGEPFLNKDIGKFFELLNNKGLKYAVSTNASNLVLFEEGSDILKNLSSLLISVPGFSQESYDRVHGFKFEKIKENITKIMANFRKAGFKGDARLIYHVYKFNLGEIQEAKAFAAAESLDFYPYYAILYQWQYVRDYLSNVLSADLFDKASSELFLENIQRTVSCREPGFTCEFFNMLLVDIEGNLKTCCQIKKGEPGYSFGSIFDLSAEEIAAQRTSQQVCKECREKGMDYYLSVYTPFDLSAGKESRDDKQLEELLSESAAKEVVLFGAGQFGIKALKYLNDRNIKVSCFSDNSHLKIGKTVNGVKVIAPTEISSQCNNPLVIITTINHRQVRNQLCSLGVEPVRFFPMDAYAQRS